MSRLTNFDSTESPLSNDSPLSRFIQNLFFRIFRVAHPTQHHNNLCLVLCFRFIKLRTFFRLMCEKAPRAEKHKFCVVCDAAPEEYQLSHAFSCRSIEPRERRTAKSSSCWPADIARNYADGSFASPQLIGCG